MPWLQKHWPVCLDAEFSEIMTLGRGPMQTNPRAATFLSLLDEVRDVMSLTFLSF